ncbi:MAG: putative tributyrin esterase [Pseudohongiellaceae bacterium]|jgi:putative tributyrin esterase
MYSTSSLRLAAIALGIIMLSPALSAQQPTSLDDVRAPIPEGLETVEFYSEAVGRTMKFDIVLPVDYYSSEKQYPVLYLLHGYMQNYTVWGRNLNAAYYARQLQDLILVMPDGGNTWFVNYARSADGEKDNWEDYLVEDLVGYVDSNYRTEARREGRAISGLSMGGFAAFAIGLRRPHLFASIGSTSGALSYARSAAAALSAGVDRQANRDNAQRDARIAEADALISQIIDIPGFSTQPQRTPEGIDFETPQQAEAYDPFSIIYKVPRSQMPHIYLDSGTADGLVNEAKEIANILMINNVPFNYMQSEGAHNSEYWRRSIGHMMAIQHEVMRRALGHRP